MDDIDKLKELRLINYLSSLECNNLDEFNTKSEFSVDEKIKIKDTITQLISNIDNSRYFFIEQWSRFGFTINYRIYYKKNFIFDFTEDYLSEKYDRHKMNKIILGDINACKCKYFLNYNPKTLSDIDY
jgi:hypothetical protein